MRIGFSFYSILTFQETRIPNHVIERYPCIIKAQRRIFSIALSPNGRYIACAGGFGAGKGDNYTIKIWDLNTGDSMINSLQGHLDQINSITYSKCGNFIASGSDDRTIRQWDISNLNQSNETMTGHANEVVGVEYSPDNKYILSCSLDQTIRIWEQKTGKEQVDKRILHSCPIRCLSLSPIKRQVVFGDRKGKKLKYGTMIYIIQFKYIFRGQILTLKPELVQGCYEHQRIGYLLGRHQKQVSSIKYSNDGKVIVSGGEYRTIFIWDTQTRKLIRQFFGHTLNVRSVAVSPNLQYVISAGNDEIVRIWDRVIGKQIGTKLTHHKEWIYSIQFSLCGKYIITGGDNQQIMIIVAPIDG